MHVINTDIEIWKVFVDRRTTTRWNHTPIYELLKKKLPVENSLLTYLLNKDRKSK